MRASARRGSAGRAVALATSAVLLGGASLLAPTLSAAATGPGVNATSIATAGIATTGIDTTSQAAVTAAYKSLYLPAMDDTVDWTGSISGCDAGTTSADSQRLSLDAINFTRALAGLDPVTLDPALNADAQQGALIMAANSALSHDVPTNWKCYTKQGSAAAAHSNLYYGVSGAQAIGGYLNDPGSTNTAAGHRRWILYPATTEMGTGSTSTTNDLYVIAQNAAAGSYADPAWVPWPTAGYFPDPLEPSGRWSLGGDAEHNYNFAKATVSVKNSSGTPLPVVVNTPAYGYGSDTLVWQVSGLGMPSGVAPLDYTVSVKGIVVGGKTISHSYVVKLFNPLSLDLVSGAGLSGNLRVGQVLTVVAPQFSPAASSLSYQWYRGNTAISGATHSIHTLVSGDLGHTISVRVAGHRSGYVPLFSASGATGPIAAALKPVASIAPTLSGSARVGRVLTATSGQWAPSAAIISFQWYRNGTPISRATSDSRLLTSRDHGKTISVRVTVRAPGYSSTSKTLKSSVVRNPPS
jgi:uncharacterized protein YkwD